jgi:hypothetical protein
LSQGPPLPWSHPIRIALYYNARRYRFVIVLSIFSDFSAAGVVFRPFQARKRPSGLKISRIKVPAEGETSPRAGWK